MPSDSNLPETDERVLHFAVEVPAERAAVWEAWTTESGVETFFAPDARIDLEPNGAYELYFDPGAAPGSRGGEGNVVLGVEPESMLTVSWNAPPRFPEMRDQRTVVVLRFADAEGGKTALQLTHLGWGDGADWDDVYAYFREAWGEVVLPRLQRRFVDGPIDWEEV